MGSLSSPPKSALLRLDARARLGEGPVWDERAGVLWWVDILGRNVHRFDPATEADVALPSPCQVGCLALREVDGLVAGMEHGVALLDTGANTWKVISSLETDRPDNRVNDGKVDPQGSFVVGTMSTTRTVGAAALYRVDGRGGTRRLAAGLTISNGLDWSPDGSEFYLIDSIVKVVRACRWPPGPDGLPDGRVAVNAGADADTGLLDGLCVDAEGMLWIAHFGAGRVARWNPRTGRELDRVSVPAPRVTSCTFGGPRLDTLFVTTARTGLDERQLAAWPQSGGLFSFETIVPGLPSRRFKEE